MKIKQKKRKFLESKSILKANILLSGEKLAQKCDNILQLYSGS